MVIDIDKEFLKSLTILYVEDDESIREALTSTLTKLFKKLYVAKDGEEAFSIFKDLPQNEIDAIVSDITMPNMDGIELLKSVKEIDSKIPFIFTTAYTDSEYLLDAIKNGASEYITKPILANDLIQSVQKITKEVYAQRLITHQKKELQQYLDIIDRVAIISKTDLKGKITFVNDIFCEIAGYSREELIGQHHNIVRHPDMPSNAFKSLWESLKNKKPWKGKVKNLTKNGDAYYVNATVIPVYDEFDKDVVEYMGIRFLTTDEEKEKREFKKKVLENIQESKKAQIESTQKIKELEGKLKQYENISLIEDNLDAEKKKNTKLLSQVRFYEKEILQVRNKNETLVKDANEKVSKAITITSQFKSKVEKYEREISMLKMQNETKNETIVKLNEQLNSQAKIIENLKDVVQHREQQLGLIK